jgi:ankyrin repeat protein
MPDHKTLWEKWCDRYYLQLLNSFLNYIPALPKPFEEMNDVEISTWLRDTKFEDPNTPAKYNIKISPVSEFCKNMQSTDKTDVVTLPLSLEDNSTLTGTAAVLEEFGKEFSLPCAKDPRIYIEFDRTKKEFDIKSARERYVFIKSLEEHRNLMAQMERQMASTDKDIEIDYFPLQSTERDQSSESDSDELIACSKQPEADDEFKGFFNKLAAAVQDITSSSDESLLDGLIQEISTLRKKLECTLDQYGRTVLHEAVEKRNHALANILISSGINPNSKEGCGATPLCIAVLNTDATLCELLLNNFAEYTGGMFGNFPSPLDMAVAMNCSDIVDLFNKHSRSIDSSVVIAMQSGNTDSPTADQSEIMAHDTEHSLSTSDVPRPFVYERSTCKEFPTAVVGDVGTCKNNRSVKNRDSSTYGWSTEVPGDMHAKGYLCEAAFKAMGVGGFHKVVNDVMKRPKLTKETFKKRKFQEQNLNRIKESVRDGSRAYGMAAVAEFHKSVDFPNSEDLLKSLHNFGDHNRILLRNFKNWLSESAESSAKHKYNQQLFTLFGPLLEMFITAGKNGDGQLREIVWVILLPIFAQLGFRNYWTEAFVHVVNFTALWPLAFREMFKNNSTVNVSGKAGHNVDLDEYVETYIVRPLKTYATGIWMYFSILYS